MCELEYVSAGERLVKMKSSIKAIELASLEIGDIFYISPYNNEVNKIIGKKPHNDKWGSVVVSYIEGGQKHVSYGTKTVFIALTN